MQDAIPQSLMALLGKEFPAAVLDDLAASARAKWITIAQRTLHSSKRDYIDSISEVMVEGSDDMGVMMRSIELTGWLANAVEQGIDGYDLRETLLGGDKPGVKLNKDGKKYRSIPFRHGTPGSQGQAGVPMGARMGPQHSQSMAFAASGVMEKGQAAALGRAIYKRAEALQAGKRLGNSKSGTGFVPLRMGKTKTTVLHVPKLAPWHKTDIYAGMKKETKTYKTATQSQYMTFRTISEANPEGWIHPGIQARRIAPQVEQFIRSIATKALQTAVRSALRGVST
jgi:hypothetical protein